MSRRIVRNKRPVSSSGRGKAAATFCASICVKTSSTSATLPAIDTSVRGSSFIFFFEEFSLGKQTLTRSVSIRIFFR